MSRVNIVLDMSKYDMFELCEQRYDFRYNQNLSGPVKANPLDRGTLVHHAAELYYEALKQRVKYEAAVMYALEKTKEVGVLTTDLSVDDINRVIEVMEEYFDHTRFLDQMFEIVEVEQPFMYTLHEDDDIGIYLTGKIDLLISDNKYTNMPMDHKSYDRDYPVGELNNQFRNYCLAVKSNYLTVNRIGFQKTLKPEQKHKRVRLEYTPFQIEKFKKNILYTIRNKYLNCVIDKYWPMNETSCEKFNRRCEFYNACKADTIEDYHYVLKSEFVTIEPWDVTKAMKKTTELLADIAKIRSEENR